MVGAGSLMGLLALYALYLTVRKMDEKRQWILQIFLWAIALPYLANTFGWILTEMGRFPWVVYGVMKIEDGISPNVPAAMVLTTLIIFTLVYGLLMAADIYLLKKYAKAGPPSGQADIKEVDDLAPSLVGAAD